MSPPLIKGGQGRSARSVAQDGTPSMFTLCVVIAALCLVIGRCSHG